MLFEILLEEFFLPTELENLKEFENDFVDLLLQLERRAMVAEIFPVSFTIRNIYYQFANKMILEEAIINLAQQFNNKLKESSQASCKVQDIISDICDYS